MTTSMPRTAEEAHAAARRFYRDMLAHVDADRLLQAGTAAACFQNAAALAQMFELRQIRMALMRIAGPGVPDGGWLAADEDVHDWHPATPTVEYDGWHPAGVR